MKVQLVKGEIKKTFGEGENSFDYYFRPLTVEEKYIVNSHIIWTTSKRDPTIDFKKTDLSELLRIAVTRIARLDDSDESKIDTIDKLLGASIEPGVLDGVMVAMWIAIWLAMSLSEELKKKLSQDSTPGETK
jgi:hypothetical protein